MGVRDKCDKTLLHALFPNKGRLLTTGERRFFSSIRRGDRGTPLMLKQSSSEALRCGQSSQSRPQKALERRSREAALDNEDIRASLLHGA